MSEDQTAGDRVQAFIKAWEGDKAVAYTTGTDGGWHQLDVEDIQEVLRLNRGPAGQIARANDTIIQAADEIQRACLRAAAAELEASLLLGQTTRQGVAWLRDRAEAVGKERYGTIAP